MVTIITAHWIIAQLRDQKIFRFYIQVVRTVHHVGVLELLVKIKGGRV